MTIKTLNVGPIGTCCYLLWEEGRDDCLVVDPGGEPERIRKAARQWTLETGETNLRFDILEKSDAGFRYIRGAF